MSEVTIERPEPHCRVWARATAALWGMADDHDLDEPVRLSDEVPVRVRYEGHDGRGEFIFDRDLVIPATRSGHHAAIRVRLRDFVTFFEVELLPPTLRLGEIAHLTRYR